MPFCINCVYFYFGQNVRSLWKIKPINVCFVFIFHLVAVCSVRKVGGDGCDLLIRFMRFLLAEYLSDRSKGQQFFSSSFFFYVQKSLDDLFQ